MLLLDSGEVTCSIYDNRRNTIGDTIYPFLTDNIG